MCYTVVVLIFLGVGGKCMVYLRVSHEYQFFISTCKRIFNNKIKLTKLKTFAECSIPANYHSWKYSIQWPKLLFCKVVKFNARIILLYCTPRLLYLYGQIKTLCQFIISFIYNFFVYQSKLDLLLDFFWK